MLALGGQQPSYTSATRVGTSGRSHSHSNLGPDDGLVDIAAADVGQEIRLVHQLPTQLKWILYTW